MVLLVGGLTSTVWIKSKAAADRRRQHHRLGSVRARFPSPSPGHGAIGEQHSPWRGSVSSPRPPSSGRASPSRSPTNSLGLMSTDKGTSEVLVGKQRGLTFEQVCTYYSLYRKVPTVTSCANPAHNLTCPPSYIYCRHGGLTFEQIAMALNGDAPTQPMASHGLVPISQPRLLEQRRSPGATRTRKQRKSSPRKRTGSHLSREASPISSREHSREHSREGSISPRGELVTQSRRISIEDSSWPPRQAAPLDSDDRTMTGAQEVA